MPERHLTEYRQPDPFYALCRSSGSATEKYFVQRKRNNKREKHNPLKFMFEALLNLVRGPKVDFDQLVKEGGIILDVRSKGEYAQGHIKGSIHIPVDQLASNLAKLKHKEKAIITCCASGMRSDTAKRILESNGYQKVYNGGSWISLETKI